MKRAEEIVGYGIFQHSSGNGDHVVRTIRDGWCPSPYSDQTPLKVFKRETSAQAHADKLNGRTPAGLLLTRPDGRVYPGALS